MYVCAHCMFTRKKEITDITLPKLNLMSNGNGLLRTNCLVGSYRGKKMGAWDG